MSHKPLLNDERRKNAHARRRDHSAESTPEAPAQYEPSVRTTPILSLQRSVGNAVVQRLLNPTTSRVIQRDSDGSYVTLPDLKVGAVHMGPTLNSRMASIGRQSRVVVSQRTELMGLVESLRMAADSKAGSAQQAAKTVAAVKPAANALKGSRRDALEEAIDKYNTSKPHLRSMMSEIEAARATIAGAAKKVESKVLSKKLIDTKRDKETAEADLKAMEEKKANANKVFSTFIDFAGMLADPAKGWSTALSAASGMVGNYIEDLALGGTYAAQISGLRDKVATLSKSMQSIEDSRSMVDIEAAASDLKAAQKILEARLNELEAAVYSATVAQDDIQKELRKLGKKGAAAADAFTEGTAIIETGNEAIEKSTRQRQSLDSLGDDIAWTFDQSDRYRQWIDSGAADLKGDEAAWARDKAIQNVRASEGYKRWLEAEVKQLTSDQEFLTGRSWQVGYEKGVETQLTKIRRK